MAGRTDSWIVAQIAAQHGVPYDREMLARNGFDPETCRTVAAQVDDAGEPSEED